MVGYPDVNRFLVFHIEDIYEAKLHTQESSTPAGMNVTSNTDILLKLFRHLKCDELQI